jgi:HSP20 family molecular chaperone IbpA
MSRETGLVKSNPQAQALAQATEARPTFTPAVDIYENKDEILVVADLPGVTPETLAIDLDKGELDITARREVVPRDGAAIGAELRDGDFRRRFVIPSGIDAAKIDATLRDGVLWLRLPKSEAVKPRQIAVRAG